MAQGSKHRRNELTPQQETKMHRFIDAEDFTKALEFEAPKEVQSRMIMIHCKEDVLFCLHTPNLKEIDMNEKGEHSLDIYTRDGIGDPRRFYKQEMVKSDDPKHPRGLKITANQRLKELVINQEKAFKQHVGELCSKKTFKSLLTDDGDEMYLKIYFKSGGPYPSMDDGDISVLKKM